ncbi:hypothetical protein DdX_17337 [Ditylenchus destructor]|uniref:Uncharacterized protein n=1 Tax=Ditylenchus destructor TaxID=166010 RepID=A0AAD4MMJ1_9BILA|nr:hypothetical protein DdX_17337 [Ditylenchus destructor]
MQGKGSATLNERLLDEFLGRVHSHITKLLRVGGLPGTFEEAVKRAQQLESPDGSNALGAFPHVAAVNHNQPNQNNGNIKSWNRRQGSGWHQRPGGRDNQQRRVFAVHSEEQPNELATLQQQLNELKLQLQDRNSQDYCRTIQFDERSSGPKSSTHLS